MEQSAGAADVANLQAATERALARVAKLDFSLLKLKLAFTKRWPPEFIAEAERRYRMFLALRLLYPDQRIPPSATIDEFWHAHILDTQAYAADCDAVFGSFLHHHPYSGMNLVFDLLARPLTRAQTRALFMRHFAIDPFDRFGSPP